MKNIKSLFVLICSVALIMGSCAKKDDEETVAVVAGTGTGNTASGTISGIDYLTGTYTMSYNGQTPSGGCISNSTAITALSSALPSGTLGFKWDIIITSSTTWSKSLQYYSDASCATLTGYFNLGYKNFAVGDSLSGLTAGSMGLPTTAKKVSYNEDNFVIKSYTDTVTSYYISTFGSGLTALGFTQGKELVITQDGDAEVNIWQTVIPSGSTETYLVMGNKSASTYPTDWDSDNIDIFRKTSE